MKIGDIIYFTTEKAKGHDTRSKYHVYLFVGDWRDDGEFGFLFINKSNSYGDGFEIKKADGYDIELDTSYICCSSPISYSEDELDSLTIEGCGRLRDVDIEPLITHVQNSHALEGHHISKISAALHSIAPKK